MLKSATDAPVFSFAGMRMMVKCIKVYDGDTITVLFEPFGKLYKISCRMAGYNSAELRSKSESERAAAIAARDALRAKLLDRVFEADFGDFDKYGRPLLSVNIDGDSIANYMISGGYGAPYDGSGEKSY